MRACTEMYMFFYYKTYMYDIYEIKERIYKMKRYL